MCSLKAASDTVSGPAFCEHRREGKEGGAEARSRLPRKSNYGYSVMPGDFRKMHETIQSMRLCETAAGGEPFVGLLFEWQVKLSQT